MKSLRLEYMIKSPSEKVWEALVNRDVIDEWGGGPAVMDDKTGTEFKLWGGDVWGKNTEVHPLQRLIQDWYGGQWDQPSRVTFDLQPDKNGTKVVLIQTNIPDVEFRAIREGWDLYYFGPMKEYLESVGRQVSESANSKAGKQ